MTLELAAVEKSVGRTVHIHPTSLRLQRGTMNVLLGPTLAGKTTLMRIMAGLDVPTGGHVLWDGNDVTGVRVQDRDIAMVYQQFINYPSMSVYDNIASPLRIQGAAQHEVDTQVRAAAEMMKLDAKQLDRKPLELSGGQQQRCALARALVKKAGLVLLDEPLANLDYKLREELRAEIPKIFEQSGAIFVYATTEPHEALLLGGNTACLWEGRITQFDTTPLVYRRPADAVTARVFSDPPMNFIEISRHGQEIRFAGGSAPAAGAFADVPDGTYIAGFRPNHLTIARAGGTEIKFQAQISGTEITGGESFVHIVHENRRWVALVHGVHDIPAGTSQDVFVDPDHVYIFGEDDGLVAAASYAQAA